MTKLTVAFCDLRAHLVRSSIFLCGHNILAGVSVTALSSHVGISSERIVWVSWAIIYVNNPKGWVSMAKMFTQTHHNVTVHVHCHPCHNLTDYITRPVLCLPLDLPQKTAWLLAALSTLRRNNKQFGQDQTSAHHFPISVYLTSKACGFHRLKFLQHKTELRRGLSFSSTYNFTVLAATKHQLTS